MYFTRVLIIFSIILYTTSSWSCVNGESLEDILNDPAIKRMLQQPINPRVDTNTSEVTLTPSEIRAQEMNDLEAEIARLKTDRNATPAEVRRAEDRLSNLQNEAHFDEIMSQPLTLRSRDVDVDDLDTSPPVARVDEPAIDTPAPEVEPEVVPVTDADREEFARLLQNPHISRNTRNPYDNFLDDFKYASEGSPVTAKQRDVLTGEYRDVEIIGHVRSSNSGDIVLARYRSPDGQVVTREVPMSSLSVSDSGGTYNLGDGDVLRGSNRFSNLDSQGRAQFAVDEMSRDAMTSTDVRTYRRLQARLDSRELTIDEMTAVIGEQDNLVRKYSPLRLHERETIEYNLDGLLEGDALNLSPGEQRAIEQINEIVQVRHGNPRAVEDRALFERAEGLTTESVLATRIKRRRTAVNQEIRALTGAGRGIDIPFENLRTWSSSSIGREIGGTVGRTRLREAVDAISNGFERNNKSILDTQDARNITNAIRTLRSELRSKNALDSPSASYLNYLELRVESYNLNFRLGQ
jgi:hypothetical protein